MPDSVDALGYTVPVDFDAMYRVMESRDRRFDGRFYVGVLSTGVYCRPACPAPMPRQDRVRFFPTAAAAELAGLRPCRRCRPESSPDSPDWDIRADLVGRGLRLIAEGLVERDGIEGLARALAVGSRHLRREFIGELGVGPLAIARTRRAQLAKQLLEQTELSSSDVAFAAGFSSLRAYNKTVRQTYGCSPRQIRSSRRSADRHPGRLQLRLSYRPPLAAAALIPFLADRAVPGVETAAGSTLARSIHTPSGAAVIELVVEDADNNVVMEVASDHVLELGAVVQAARRYLDLDADPSSIDAVLGADSALAGLVRQDPGIRLPGTVDPLELITWTTLAQEMFLGRARVMTGRIAARFGTPLEVPIGSVTHNFPTAEQLATASLGHIGLSERQAHTISRVAEFVAAGKLDLSGGAELSETAGILGDIPAIGPWARAYVGMRVLRDPDAFFEGDPGVVRAFDRLGLPATPSAILERAERWRPWRAYAVMHLWNLHKPWG